MQYVRLVSFSLFFFALYYCLFQFQEYKTDIFLKPLVIVASNQHNFNYSNHSLLFPFYHHHFNCSAIINGNLAEIRRAERYVNYNLQSNNLSRILSNVACIDLIYDNYPITDVELQYPVAFGIIAYKNPVQLLKLFRTIYRPWNYYCVHLDVKGKVLEHLIQNLVRCFPNFVISDVRENVKWGEMSLLKGALHCMTKLGSSNNSDQWNYYLNIAGSDFPLKTNLEMVQYLKSLNGSSDVQDLKDDDSWKYKYSFKNGITKASLEHFRQALKNGTYYPTKSPVPLGLVIHKGSFSGAFHREFVKFILRDKISVDLKIWLNDTFIPDEAYWSTLYHSYYKHEILNSNSSSVNFRTRYTHWGDNKPYCSGLSEHGLCIYGLYDLKWLLRMPHLFAHKFDQVIQPITLDCIEEYIKNKTSV